jgi:two-component system phosphate regulon sensor histidine kinase PhoR
MNSEGMDLSLAACAYELKTPLILMRQLAFELGNTADADRRAEICRQMRLTAERSLRLADNLTKVARLEGALFELEPVQVVGLCREVVNDLAPLTKTRAQEITIKSTRKTTVCIGNRELLKSILVGLLDDALQYNRKGGQVLIATRMRRGAIELSVRDDGPIIDLAQFRKLKSSLGKYNLPVAARPLSSGLGIAIAEKFISAMNGQLSVSRHQTGGITFRALLPISRQLSILEL